MAAKSDQKVLPVRLEPDLYTAFAVLAKADRRSMANLAEVLIARYVAEQQAQPPSPAATVSAPPPQSVAPARGRTSSR